MFYKTLLIKISYKEQSYLRNANFLLDALALSSVMSFKFEHAREKCFECGGSNHNQKCMYMNYHM